MGRNIFQSDAPKAMIAAINAVVHKNAKPKEAYELFSSLKAKGGAPSFRGAAQRRARNP
jgi:3-hydroxy-5-phosphonooxypentane-2,4-dione thiolase